MVKVTEMRAEVETTKMKAETIRITKEMMITHKIKKEDKSKIECYMCGNYGHYCNECYTRMPKNKEQGEKSNFVEKKEEVMLLMAYHVKEELESKVSCRKCVSCISISVSSTYFLNTIGK